MTGSVEKAVAEIRRGKPSPVYLLHGDEFLAKEGAKTILDALVPPEQQSLNVETVTEDRDLASLPMRVNTVPFFGGSKVIVVHESKAFVSKQTVGNLAKRSLEAWQAGDTARATRLFLQGLGAAGVGDAFLDRAARGEVAGPEWERVLSTEPDPEEDQCLRGIAAAALAEGLAIPDVSGGNLARVYEETLARGIPPTVSLILTAEVADERRALFKKISEVGFVVDCGVRSKRAWDTQMNPEAARAKIRQMVAAAGKTIDDETVARIVERTGSTMRGLVSEMEKVLLYILNRPALTTADVLQVLSHSREANVFDLTNALSSRDAGKAIQALRSLLSQREPALRILGMLAGEVRNLIIARAVLDRRLDGKIDATMNFATFRTRLLPRLAGEIEGDDGSAAKLLEMNPFRAFNLLKGASRFPMQDLLHGLAAIQETDRALKTSGQPEVLLLEQLLITLCGGA